MSVEEDTELRDLVVNTLETNGILTKLKAQLRANIYVALEEENVFKEKVSETNQKLNTFLQKHNGKLLFLLVSEFLDYFNLQYTQSVFKSEACMPENCPVNRIEILNKLNLAEDSQPILYSLIQNAQNSFSDSTIPNESIEETPKPITEIRTTVKSINKTFTVPSYSNSSSFEESLSIAEDVEEPSSETSMLINFDKSVLPPKEDNVVDITKEPNLLDQTLQSSPPERVKPFSSLSSLQDLPPLNINLNKSRTETILLPSLYSPESENKKDRKSSNTDSEDLSFDLDLNEKLLLNTP